MNSGYGSQPNQPGSLPNEEPGAEDNRLSVNPNDPRFAALLEWVDGNRYRFKNMEVEQMSPGEFLVISAEVDGQPAEQPEIQGEEAEAKGNGSVEPDGSEYPSNPAVARMLQG